MLARKKKKQPKLIPIVRVLGNYASATFSSAATDINHWKRGTQPQIIILCNQARSRKAGSRGTSVLLRVAATPTTLQAAGIDGEANNRNIEKQKQEQYTTSTAGKRTLNVAKDARIDPPTHVENLRSGGAVMRILRFLGACFRTCC